MSMPLFDTASAALSVGCEKVATGHYARIVEHHRRLARVGLPLVMAGIIHDERVAKVEAKVRASAENLDQDILEVSVEPSDDWERREPRMPADDAAFTRERISSEPRAASAFLSPRATSPCMRSGSSSRDIRWSELASKDMSRSISATGDLAGAASCAGGISGILSFNAAPSLISMPDEARASLTGLCNTTCLCLSENNRA